MNHAHVLQAELNTGALSASYSYTSLSTCTVFIHAYTVLCTSNCYFAQCAVTYHAGLSVLNFAV